MYMNSQIYKWMVLFFVVCSISAYGQEKISYTGSVEAAVLVGGYESNGVVSTTHGIRFKSHSVSFGAGIDFYRFRSVPVFIDIKKFISIGSLQPYIQASAGLNIAWPTSEQMLAPRWWSGWWGASDTMSFSNGFYSKAVAGIVFNPKSPVKISAVAGWSLKSITTRYFEEVWNGTTTVFEPRTSVYKLNRLYIGIGVAF
jgi:hypothetical protein